MLKMIEGDSLGISEKLRTQGKFAQGLAVARKAVGDKLSPEKISEQIEDKELVTLLGVAARLTFSELTSLLKREVTPWGVHTAASKMLSSIGQDVYTNDEFRTGIKDIVEDDHGNEYYFDLEMARDVAEFLVAVSVIFPGKEAEGLHNLAATIWNGISYHSHKVPSQRSFFNLERNRFLYQIGKKEDIYWTAVIADLQEFFETHTKVEEGALIIENKDRVATVVARALELGKALGCKELEDLARSLLEKIAAVDTVYADAADKEHSKATKEQFRKKVLNALAPLSGLPGKRQQLATQLRDFGVNQRNRLGVARF